MKAAVKYREEGLIDYKECWDLQQRIFDGVLAAKGGERATGAAEEAQAQAAAEGRQDEIIAARPTLLLCEHPHVYTLGRSGSPENMLITEEFLGRIGASFHRIDRGGDITYHGPGQLVGYPILDLDALGLGLKEYVHLLEQSIIDTVAEFGIRGERSEGATGVWLAADGRRGLRKISAIGVRSSRFVTMHGFSLNVAPRMEYFSYINPCGFTDRGVTSMEAELGAAPDMGEVKERYRRNFEKIFNVGLE